MNKKGFWGVIAFVIVVIFLVLLVGYFSLFGKHIYTGSGQHTGIVTATETSGMIWKTGSAYVKTSSYSSQEDKYCVIDKNLLEKLTQFQAKQTEVTISYDSYFIVGYSLCDGEAAIITSVSDK